MCVSVSDYTSLGQSIKQTHNKEKLGQVRMSHCRRNQEDAGQGSFGLWVTPVVKIDWYARRRRAVKRYMISKRCSNARSWLWPCVFTVIHFTVLFTDVFGIFLSLQSAGHWDRSFSQWTSHITSRQQSCGADVHAAQAGRSHSWGGGSSASWAVCGNKNQDQTGVNVSV